MNRLFRKIPITFWTILIILACSIVVFNDVFTFHSGKLEVITQILTIAGLYFLAIQVKNQTRTEQISNEYLNQANFNFRGFCQKELKGAEPCLCSQPNEINYNQCSDIHWLNLTHVGSLPAKDVKITLIHQNEIKDVMEIVKERTQEETMIYPNDEHQFKLPEQAIPINLLNNLQNGKFYVLLEYKSLYTKIKYKRIYELNYSPKLKPEIKATTWVKSIRYFSISLKHITDSESISWKDVLSNLWNKLIIKLNIKKSISIEEWLIDM